MKKQNFYESISRYYDYIFPYNYKHFDFINKVLDNNTADKKILDIGCGTGSLSIELSKIFNKVIGIDLDNKMLNRAKDKIKLLKNKPEFYNLNMLDISKQFDENSFDTICCFGNTLVHLENLDNINSFLESCTYLLKPKSKLLIQIINYDRILDQKINALKTIENNKIKFERIYEKESKIINFITKLTVKEKNIYVDNSIPLFPILKKDIHKLLINNGFEDIKFYGSFDLDDYSENSVPLIIEATI